MHLGSSATVGGLNSNQGQGWDQGARSVLGAHWPQVKCQVVQVGLYRVRVRDLDLI